MTCETFKMFVVEFVIKDNYVEMKLVEVFVSIIKIVLLKEQRPQGVDKYHEKTG